MAIHSLVPRRASGVRPFWGLRGGLTDLFDEFWRDSAAAPPAVQGFAPRVDIEETEQEVRVVAELPGVEEKDFEVSLEDDVLSIRGEKKTESEERREGFYHVERSSGSFQRTFRIPWEVKAEDVKADFRNGVLTVTLPKPVAERPEPRTIPVTSK